MVQVKKIGGVRSGMLALCALFWAGCDDASGRQIPVGARLFNRSNHEYFGEVISFETNHDFRNGADPIPAVLIHYAPPGKVGRPETEWTSVSSVLAEYEVKSGA